MSDNLNTAGTSILAMLLNAPLCGAIDDDRVLHAIDMDAIDVDGPPFTARCGVPVRLVPLHSTRDGERVVVPMPWPPKVKDLPSGVTRCPRCVRPNERRRKGPYVA